MNVDAINIIESKEYYQNFNIIISYYFIFFDFLFYIIISYIIKSKNNSVSLLKYKLYILFIVDIIYRISFIKTYLLDTSFSKELLLTLLSSCQFYLILSFLKDASKRVELSGNFDCFENFENLFPFRNSTYFFFIFFSYERFCHGFNKEIQLIENLVILGGFFKIYGYFRNKVYEIIIILRKIEQKNEFIFILVEYQTVNPFIFFTFCCILNIISLFIDNPIILIYSKILMIIIKEIGKYLIFVLLGSIIYCLKKYLFKEEKSPDISNSDDKVQVK